MSSAEKDLRIIAELRCYKCCKLIGYEAYPPEFKNTVLLRRRVQCTDHPNCEKRVDSSPRIEVSSGSEIL